MKLFAVSDLHMPGNQDKPMDVFGGNWSGHFDKIREDWLARVSEDDAVLIDSSDMTIPEVTAAIAELCK